jgi:tetratricopeptide (TPR) repeat protein
MWSYLKVHGSTDDFIRLFSIALEAARRLQDRYAEAVALHNLGQTYKRMRRFDEALDLLHQALRIRYERNDHFGIAVTRPNWAPSTCCWVTRRRHSTTTGGLRSTTALPATTSAWRHR